MKVASMPFNRGALPDDVSFLEVFVRVTAVDGRRLGHWNLNTGPCLNSCGVGVVFAVAALRFTEVLLHRLGTWGGAWSPTSPRGRARRTP
jgi:hypothetical protein